MLICNSRHLSSLYILILHQLIRPTSCWAWNNTRLYIYGCASPMWCSFYLGNHIWDFPLLECKPTTYCLQLYFKWSFFSGTISLCRLRGRLWIWGLWSVTAKQSVWICFHLHHPGIFKTLCQSHVAPSYGFNQSWLQMQVRGYHGACLWWFSFRVGHLMQSIHYNAFHILFLSFTGTTNSVSC